MALVWLKISKKTPKLAEFYYYCIYLSVLLIVEWCFPMKRGPEERILVHITNLGSHPKKYKGESREIDTARGEKPKSCVLVNSLPLWTAWKHIFKKPTFAFVHDHDEVISF